MVDKGVRCYTSPTCPWCRKAKEFLTAKGVQYTDYNVTEDRDKFDEMARLSGQRGVPVIVVGQDVIVGFNEGRLEQALKAWGDLSPTASG